MSMFVSGYYQIDAMNKEFDSSSKSTLAYKKNFLHTQTKSFKNYLTAVDTTYEFKDYIQNFTREDTHSKKHTTDVIMAITQADSNIMQFRFIDKNGYEVIRIERDSIGSSVHKIDKKRLQNKKNRYYFKDTKKVARDEIWFSRIDLNIEHGKIVKPIVPTLRIAKPYYSNNEFRGILIINIFMEKILDEIMKSELFNVSIVDGDSHILTTNFKGYREGAVEWTRYLKSTQEIKYIKDQYRDNLILDTLLQDKHTSIELSDILNNGEGLKVILEEKSERVIKSTKDLMEYMLVMGILVFTLSFPVAIIFSRYPVRLHENLDKQLEIVDRYVCMTRTDIDGNITYVSKAYTELSGYSKEELIGKNHRILKDPNTPKSFYEDMWLTILDGKSWSGELNNIGKNGETFSIKAHIAPIFEDEKIVGFTSIRENITDQKIIEEISIKDELTGAYNRRCFNKVFSEELRRAKRKNDLFCIAMFDIDYFKKYNDTYGHIKGDEALKSVVEEVQSKLKRSGDYLFRVGGEEFIVIYSQMLSIDEAKKFSETLVKAVENLGIEHKSSEVSDVLTVSLGLLNLTDKCSMDEKTILQTVDKLLYEAKEGGRNKFVSMECL